jgi:outer membrane protein assembly factor BamA
MVKNYSALILLGLILLCSNLYPAEEPVLYLDKVVITGLKTISPDEIIKSLKLQPGQRYEAALGNEIRDRIQAELETRGFFFAQVSQADIVPAADSRVALQYVVEEGFSGYLQELNFRGNRYFSADKLKQRLNADQLNNIRLTDLPRIMNEVMELYAARGYLFVQVGLDSLAFTEKGLAATIGITEGKIFKAENYIFSGNKVTRPRTLLRISGLNLLKTYTPSVLKQAEKNITERPYIKTCRIAPLNDNTLGISVEETSMSRIEGLLGLSSAKDSGQQKLTGYLRLQFLNLWGTDRSLLLDWKSISRQMQQLELSYHESGIDRFPIAGDLTFQRSRLDSSWTSIGGTAKIYYYRLHHRFGADLSSETLYPDIKDSPDIIKSDYFSAGAFWEYSRSENAPGPLLEDKIRLKTGWLAKRTADKTDHIPVTEADALTYKMLTPRIAVSWGVHYREKSDKTLKSYEQYKLGGFSNLRGYLEDYFSSWRTGWINSELSYLLTSDSRIYLLLDNGMFQTAEDKVKADLFSTGLGINVGTKLGVISITYALAIGKDYFQGLGNGLLHMGLASSF